MSRLPPIPAEWANRPEGRTLLRAFERLCLLETDVEGLTLDLATLQTGIEVEAAKALPSGRLVQVNTDLQQRASGLVGGLLNLSGVSGKAPAPGKPGAPGGGGLFPPDVVKQPSNHLALVQAVNAIHPVSNACAPPEGNGSFAFLNEVVRRLRLESIRWGFGCVRDNCSETRTDQVLYYAGLDMGQPPSPNDIFYNFDIIGKVCGASPTPQWDLKTIPGLGTSTHWKHPR